MKKKLIIIAIVVAALLLVGFRYSIIEQKDLIPDEVRLGFDWLLPSALADGDDADGDDDQPSEAEQEPEAPAEPTAEPVPTPEPTQQPLLRRGDSGEEVELLQKRLKDLGFLNGAADGQFGQKTEQAVIGFKQHVSDLAEEQAAAEKAAHDRLVEAALYRQEAALEAQIPTLTRAEYEQEMALMALIPELPDEKPERPAAKPEPEKPVFHGGVDEETYRLLLEEGFDEYQMKLATGSGGAEVRRLQRRLQDLGYLSAQPDGVFGSQTVKAVSDFQKRNELTADGVAGEMTQRALFSSSAVRQAKKPDKPYLIKISTKDQRVYVYGWNEQEEAHTRLVKTMICSTGLPDTPTPKGTFTSTSPVVRWGYFPKYDVWAQYLYRIQGPYLFHSVLYDEADESTVKWGSVNKLGSPASHGCIRLSVEDAKWIYDNCPAGTTVTVY